jgi:3',5'-cyclic AMP phosphodiesterase CpdA
MKFIHLSDLHFKSDDNKSDDNKCILERLDYIKTYYPDHNLIITGDLVDNGEVREFENAKNALEPFSGRIFICPGNHDFGSGGIKYSVDCFNAFNYYLSMPLQQQTFSEDKTPVLFPISEGENSVLLIALNTNFLTRPKGDCARGEVGWDQRSALEKILADNDDPNIVKILFFHHHPFERELKDVFGRIKDKILEMEDSAELMTVIQGKVNVVLFGHKHCSGHWEGDYGIQNILASGNSCEWFTASEIIIEDKKISKVDFEIPIINRGG